MPGDAHGFPFICIFLLQKFCKFFLVKKDRMEVCPLSREIMLQSLSVPITGAAFAFFHRSYSAFPWASLTVCFSGHAGENMGLPRFT